MRKLDHSHIILPVFLIFVGCVDAETTQPTVAAPSADEDSQEFREAELWESWPIIIDGVTAYDVDTYEYEISMGVDITFSDFSDVVTRWYFFQPCDDEFKTDEQNAYNSFGGVDALNYVETAHYAGVKVLMPLPFLGDTSESCNGVVRTIPDPDQLWDRTDTIQIPLDKDQITPAFTSYWAAKAAYYVPGLLNAAPPGDPIWGWRVIEELRSSDADELEFALAVRDTVNTEDGYHPMISYTGQAYMPDASMLWTLAEKGDVMTSSNPETYELDPVNPVARFSNYGVVADYYPKYPTFERDPSGYMIKMFDHVVSGAYMDYSFGDRNDENRIWSYHRIRLGREALDNLATVYAANEVEESISQDPPEHLLFHAPGLTADYTAEDIVYDGDATAETARHDFWSGIHEATGIFIYSFAYNEDSGPIWPEYIRALYLIKQEMRLYLATGTKSTPTLTHNGSVQTVPGDYYITMTNPDWDDPKYSALAMPESPDPQYPTIVQTLFRIDDIGYLIVTNSWEQPADIQVDFPDCIDTVEIVSGSSSELGWWEDDLFDEFDGIDGRVYKITFETCVP